MKFTTTTIAFALLAPLALAQEYTAVAPVPRDPSYLEKRDVSATVVVDGLRYRTCPRTSCSAPGQFAKGTRISLSCFTRENTDTIEGDKYVLFPRMMRGYRIRRRVLTIKGVGRRLLARRVEATGLLLLLQNM
jgi:hypothetical protein